MNRKNIMLLIAVAVASAFTTLLLVNERAPDQVMASDSMNEAERGPHGGRLLQDGELAAELSIFETGMPPEFHLYAYKNGEPLDPDEFSASVELERLGGARDSFTFAPEGDYLRGFGVVREPHSFDVHVAVIHAGKSLQWQYENYEGRTEIPQRIALDS